MVTDFSFSLENRPGTGAAALETLGRAGINVLGVCAVSGGQVVHLAVEDGDAGRARQALQGAGVQIGDERKALIIPVEDRPGAGAELLRRVADGGINAEFLYLATNTRLVLGVDDPEKAQTLV